MKCGATAHLQDYSHQMTERPSEADVLQKKAPLQARARGVATARSARVGKLSPIRTLFNVRLAALFHEKGRRPKPTPLCQLQRSRAYEGDLVSRVSGPCEKGECHQRSYGPAHLLTSRVGSRAVPIPTTK
jgi:hypothetical protein